MKVRLLDIEGNEMKPPREARDGYSWVYCQGEADECWLEVETYDCKFETSDTEYTASIPDVDKLKDAWLINLRDEDES